MEAKVILVRIQARKVRSFCIPLGMVNSQIAAAVVLYCHDTYC